MQDLKLSFALKPVVAVWAVVALLMAGSANALFIEIDAGIDGSIDFTAIDNGINDLNGLAGQVTAFANVGSSAFTIAASSGAPDIGELFDINFLTTLAANTSWQIRIADDTYLLGDNPLANAFSLVTPTRIDGNHTISVQTLVDGQLVLDSTNLVGGQNQSASAVVALSEPTTIEHIITLVSGNGAMGVSTFDTRTVVTEPGSLALLGIGMLGLAAIRRRRA